MIRLYLMDAFVLTVMRCNRHMAAGVLLFLLLLPAVPGPLEKVEKGTIASIKDSIYREFHENGVKKTEIHFRNGQEHGIFRSWYSDGTPEMVCHYSNGKLDGEKTRWYQSGAMKSRSNWTLGKQEGLSETWFENGQLQCQGNYRNNKRCAEFRHWYENGQLYSILSFKEGRLNGPVKWYHSNSELAIVGFYGDSGEREFLWQLYHNNGEKCAQINYENGIVRKKEYYAPDAVIDSMFRAIEMSAGK
jgi:antitoxin component YwqK of YwqJK toxin-antitoxin module